MEKKKRKTSIDANEQIIAKSKDGTKERVYRQCSHIGAKISPRSLAYATSMALLALADNAK